MPSGHRVNGTDLDDLLEPWQAGDGNAPATGFKVANVDINQRYAPAAAGVGYAGATGYRQLGVDIAGGFAARGSRVGGGGGAGIVNPLSLDAQTYYVNDFTPVGGNASLFLDVKRDGTWLIRSPSAGTLAAGNWYIPTTTAIGDGYEVRFTATSGSGGDIVNAAEVFTALSATRTVELSASSSGEDITHFFTVVVEIRPVGGGVVSSGTFNAEINVGSTGGV